MESRVIVLPPAGREEQIERWGLTADHVGARVRGAHAEDAEPIGYDDGHTADELDDGVLGFLQDGGWHAVEPTKGRRRGEGTTSHRGVLHPDEHVDADALREALETELGFTVDDVQAVYRQGRKSAAQLGLRARIDARVLELANAGANLAHLGRALGFPVKSNGNVRALENALARARKENG